MGKKQKPTARPGIYELYWHFASERQQLFERRRTDQPAPWTSDPILQTYKFCNVFRAADRVSQHLIRHVACADEDTPAEDRLFRITAYRTFSKPETWEALTQKLDGPPTLKYLASGAFTRALDDLKKTNAPLYTNAFILCANKAFGHNEKHRNHADLFTHMFVHNQAGSHLQRAKSLKDVVAYLQSFPLIGPFMAYQTAIDLNYSNLINFSENDFTQPGPGALRGLKKIFTNLGDYTPAEVIMNMVENQQEEFNRLGLPAATLFGRPLHAIDCQGLFCETDKYCREAAPHLASNRVQIKTKFTPAIHPLPQLFFPPKWNINPTNPPTI